MLNVYCSRTTRHAGGIVPERYCGLCYRAAVGRPEGGTSEDNRNLRSLWRTGFFVFYKRTFDRVVELQGRGIAVLEHSKIV
jgi:hypothetical protein